MSWSIEAALREFLQPRPRLLCICESFAPGERDAAFYWTRCANCRGWMSDEMRAENSRPEGQ